MTPDEVKTWIDTIFESFRHADDADIDASLPASVTADTRLGKLYEAYVLAYVLRRLKNEEGFDIRLRSADGYLHLRSSPGPIKPNFSHFDLRDRNSGATLKAWTDIEFVTLGHHLRTNSGQRKQGRPVASDRHELDIVLVGSEVTGYPRHHEVVLGIECKHVARFEKAIVRAALGVRRELSLLTAPTETGFETWPRTTVPASPPSVLIVYSTQSKISDFEQAGEAFGVDFEHLPFGKWP
ncbi:hypothetical protein ACFVVM_02935 [Nocardia sp. NPDC058176]|uniref:hypothetical protein n=1 Tax=Nocardia sp. NPDC058176 TaxID=3346368 RepID=UPI0036D8881C